MMVLQSIQQITRKQCGLLLAALGAILLLAMPALARDIAYEGGEEVIHVKPGDPSQITFPGKIEGGFKRKNSNLVLERQGDFLIIFAQPTLQPDGEAIIVHLDDKRTYSLRVKPATSSEQRDGFVRITDTRAPDLETEEGYQKKESVQPDGFAPQTVVSGLMREMILVAEFGKRKGITGYRRSNRYSGETVLHDGAIIAKVDEIFMGSNLWGYVLSVENLLDTTQRLDPASFRHDGTRAVSIERLELAPKPKSDEQK
ncbi:MAG: type-F conjugative transfer system secretin TraK, partial [Bdellovibrionales bacterium]|nr:type-F conjugative transfer system secretin TraK [Bdellovibrionales bacterium]